MYYREAKMRDRMLELEGRIEMSLIDLNELSGNSKADCKACQGITFSPSTLSMLLILEIDKVGLHSPTSELLVDIVRCRGNDTIPLEHTVHRLFDRHAMVFVPVGSLPWV